MAAKSKAAQQGQDTAAIVAAVLAALQSGAVAEQPEQPEPQQSSSKGQKAVKAENANLRPTNPQFYALSCAAALAGIDSPWVNRGTAGDALAAIRAAGIDRDTVKLSAKQRKLVADLLS
jgi:hypothetical protein